MGRPKGSRTGGTRPSGASLTSAFRDDHARLGRGFFELSARLRQNDVAGARAVAEQIDVDAGAHVAFEEEELYPRLAVLIGRPEVDEMYREHAEGLDVVAELVRHGAHEPLDEATRTRLAAEAATMSEHIAHCGELFGALGGLEGHEQAALLERLLAWRVRRPRWTTYASRTSQRRRGAITPPGPTSRGAHA